jgi:hypothetical protein
MQCSGMTKKTRAKLFGVVSEEVNYGLNCENHSRQDEHDVDDRLHEMIEHSEHIVECSHQILPS